MVVIRIEYDEDKEKQAKGEYSFGLVCAFKYSFAWQYKNRFEISTCALFFAVSRNFDNYVVCYPSGADLKPRDLKGSLSGRIYIIWICLSSDDFSLNGCKFGCFIRYFILCLVNTHSRAQTAYLEISSLPSDINSSCSQVWLSYLIFCFQSLNYFLASSTNLRIRFSHTIRTLYLTIFAHFCYYFYHRNTDK